MRSTFNTKRPQTDRCRNASTASNPLFLTELANGPTLTYAAWKLTVNRSVLNELDGYTDYERQLANLVRTTEDHGEGRVSFREKRPARYVGR